LRGPYGDDLQQALALAFVCLLLHLQCRKCAYLVNTVGPAAFFCLFFFTPGVLLSLSGYAVLCASAWVLSLVAETLVTLTPILIVAWGRLVVATLLASLSFVNGAVWVSLSTLEWISIYPALACRILVSASTVATAHHGRRKVKFFAKAGGKIVLYYLVARRSARGYQRHGSWWRPIRIFGLLPGLMTESICRARARAFHHQAGKEAQYSSHAVHEVSLKGFSSHAW
jgi:hypothetical protein